MQAGQDGDAGSRRAGLVKTPPYWSTSMSFVIYIIGVMIFIAGLIYGAILLNVPAQWITAGAIVLLGLSVLVGVNTTRQKDSAG